MYNYDNKKSFRHLILIFFMYSFMNLKNNRKKLPFQKLVYFDSYCFFFKDNKPKILFKRKLRNIGNNFFYCLIQII